MIAPPTLFTCSACATWSQGAPPHGWGKPCPHSLAVKEATVAMLDAQRMSYIRQAGGVEGMAETMRRMFGEDDPE